MPAYSTCQPLEHPVRALRSLEVIDEPAYLSRSFHPTQQGDDLLIFKVMGHQRIDNDIYWRIRSIFERVSCYPTNSKFFRR